MARIAQDPYIASLDHWSASPEGVAAKVAQLSDEAGLRQQCADLCAELERTPSPFEMSRERIEADYAEMLRLTAALASVGGVQ
jgi:hypothetical protein